MDDVQLDLMVANDLKDVTAGSTKALILSAAGTTDRFQGSKAELADRILDEVMAKRG
jgi:phosphopantothenoylcysteine synthetase/decarboxylase